MPENTTKQLLRAALLQFDIRPGEVQHKENTAAALLDEAAACGAQLVLLPELWNMGYDLTHLPELAQNLRQGSSARLLMRKAKEYGMYIFGGTIAEKRGDTFYNTALVIDDKGEIIYKYRKLHLFPNGLQEPDYFAPGDEWGLVETPWGLFGLAICYDLRFPATIQNLTLRGANTLIVPAQWPTIRAEHWLLLNQARAIDHQVFLLACNRTGKDHSGKYPGWSMALNPLGEFICGGREATEQGILLADFDYSCLPKIRASIPVYDDRLRILDEIDDSQL